MVGWETAVATRVAAAGFTAVVMMTIAVCRVTKDGVAGGDTGGSGGLSAGAMRSAGASGTDTLSSKEAIGRRLDTPRVMPCLVLETVAAGDGGSICVEHERENPKVYSYIRARAGA